MWLFASLNIHIPIYLRSKENDCNYLWVILRYAVGYIKGYASRFSTIELKENFIRKH